MRPLCFCIFVASSVLILLSFISATTFTKALNKALAATSRPGSLSLCLTIALVMPNTGAILICSCWPKTMHGLQLG